MIPAIPRRLAYASAGLAVLATVALAHVAAPTTPDPAAAATALADAYAASPDTLAATAAALPDGARALLAGSQLRSPGPSPSERLTVVTGNPSSAQLAGLAETGPIGVAVHGGITVFVAVPAPGGRHVWQDAIVLLGALLAAGLAALGRRPGGSPTAPTALRPARADEARADHARADQVGAERAALVSALADLAPQLPPGLEERAVAVLATVGVTAHDVDGESFDPARHTAVGSLPAPSPDWSRRIARTERPYFADRGRPLARPLVVVYTDPAGPASPTGAS